VGENARTQGQLMADEKTKKIKAIPELLDMIDIEGDVVSADTIGCQKDIARKIIEKGADFVLALKGNRTNLHENNGVLFRAGKRSWAHRKT
jgi:predicted transposase YbfD/YdcC